jgi:hypothetical protein
MHSIVPGSGSGRPRSPRRRRIRGAWLTGWALVVAVSSAAAQETATVILKNGGSHPPVAYEVLPAFNCLELQGDGAPVRVSFSEIDAVVDSKGVNIAPALLGRRYRPAGLEVSGQSLTRPARRIVLASGQQVERVRYALNPVRRELIIYEGAPPQAIPYDAIQEIFDENDVEVTGLIREVQGGPSPPVIDGGATGMQDATPAPESVSGTAEPVVATHDEMKSARRNIGWEPARSRSSLPWTVAIQADAGVDGALGDYYEGTHAGPGFGGVVHLAIHPEIALRGSVTMLGMQFDDSVGLVSLDPSVTIVSQEYDLDALRLTFGLEYYSQLRRWDRRGGFGYVHTSAGAIRHGMSGRVVVRSGGQDLVVTASTTDWRFTMTAGAGLVYIVRPQLGLTAAGDLDFVWTKVYYSNGSTGVGVKGFVPGFRVGLAYVR